MTGELKSVAHQALGRAIRVERARRGLSQQELGERCGMHRNYVGAVERGEINLTFDTLVTLAAGLALPPSEVLRLGEEQATFRRVGRPIDAG